MGGNILDIIRLRSSVQDLKSCNLWVSLIAECVGTFILVFIGLGACVNKNVDLIAVAVAFGMGGVLGIWLIAPISGGNINPAVSFGLLIARQISLIRCLLYWLAQVVGALLAAEFIQLMARPGQASNGLSKPSVNSGAALACEVLITCLLVFTVMRLCVEKNRTDTEKSVAPVAIGTSIMVGVLCGASISGGSMNPARTIGPAVIYRYKTGLWIYVVGPLLGGALAGLLQQLIFTSELSLAHIKSYLLCPNFDKPCKEDVKEEKYDEEKGIMSNTNDEKTEETVPMTDIKEE